MLLIRSLLAMGLLLSPVLVQAKVQVFACEPEWAALAQAIGGDKLSVFSATTAQQDVHQIQARPSLISQLRKADLLFCTGAELEVGWLPLLLERAANPKVLPGKLGYLMAADQVELLDKLDKVDRSMGDVHAAGNPHFHLDPYRMLKVAQALQQRLSQIDTANASQYQQQGQQFQMRWQQSIKQWEQQAAPLKGKSVVVHHKDWRYLAVWLGLKEVASLEPKPGIPPSASYLAQLKQQLTATPPQMILRAVYQEDKPSLWLSRQLSVPALALPYTVGGNEEAVDLFSLYQTTIKQLLAASK